MHEKSYGLQPPRAPNSPISYDVWLDTVLPSTHIVNNHFDTKVHIYALLNDANKIKHFSFDLRMGKLTNHCHKFTQLQFEDTKCKHGRPYWIRLWFWQLETSGKGMEVDKQLKFKSHKHALSKLLKREGKAGAEGAIFPHVGHLQPISTLKIGADCCQLCQYKLTKLNPT